MVCDVLNVQSKKRLKPIESKKETQVTIRCSWETRNRWGAFVKGNARTLKDAEKALVYLLDLSAAQVKFI